MRGKVARSAILTQSAKGRGKQSWSRKFTLLYDYKCDLTCHVVVMKFLELRWFGCGQHPATCRTQEMQNYLEGKTRQWEGDEKIYVNTFVKISCKDRNCLWLVQYRGRSFYCPCCVSGSLINQIANYLSVLAISLIK